MSRCMFITLCFLCFFIYSAPAQYLSKAQVKEVRGILAKNKRDTSHVHAYLDMAIYYSNRPAKLSTDLDSAIFLSHEALALSRKLNFHRGEASGYLSAANALRLKGDVVKEKEYVEKAVQIYEASKLYNGLVNTYVMMAYSWKERSYIDKAIRLSQQHHMKASEQYALSISAELYDEKLDYTNSRIEWQKSLAVSLDGGTPFTADHYGKLAAAHSYVGEYEKALKYGLESVKIVEDTHDSTILVANIYNRLGNTYYSLKKPNEAITYFKKAATIAQFYLDDLNFFTMLHNAALVMHQQKRSQEALDFMSVYLKKYTPTDGLDRLMMSNAHLHILTAMGKPEQARPYSEQIVADYNLRGKKDIFALSSLISYYMLTGDYEQAAGYIAICEEYYSKNKRLHELTSIYLRHFKLDSARNDFESAIRYYQKYKLLNDSTFNDRKFKQLQELEVQYQTQKKDGDIRLLQQQTELQKVLGERKDRDLILRRQDILLLQKQSELQETRAAKHEQDLVIEKQNVTLLTRQQQLQQALAKENEKNIELLTHQSKLQETELKQAHLTRNITILGLILLGVTVGLLYNRYQIKQRSNREISQKNAALQLMVQEKELLMKEIHHRAKNNLHMVISMLESQSVFLKHDAREAIQSSQHRIYAMSLLHQKLYQSDTLTGIDLGIYLPELVANLKDSFVTGSHVSFTEHIEPLWVDISQAVPLGLIVNEALVNALKYAFPDQAGGKISITLCQVSATHASLVISDNGVGLPKEFNIHSVNSLGMTLMKGLSGEINGAFNIRNINGTLITVNFPTTIDFKNMESVV